MSDGTVDLQRLEEERRKLEDIQRSVDAKVRLLDALLAKGSLLAKEDDHVTVDARSELVEWEKRLMERSLALDDREAALLGISTERLTELNSLPIETVDHLQRPVMAFIRRRRFSRLVREVLQSKEHAPLRRRYKAINEILESERVYLSGLGMLIVQFVTPLKQGKGVSISPAEHAKLFRSIELIYGLNREFHRELAERLAQRAAPNISDIFLKFGPSLKLYADYVMQQEAAQETLKELTENKKFATWLRKAEEESGGQTLQSFLILAVQRIPRYSLLLREVIKYTQPSHVDFDGLNRAYDMIKEICDYLDLRTEQHDLEHRIETILRREDVTDPELLMLPQLLVVLCRAELDRKVAFSYASVRSDRSKEQNTSTVFGRTKQPKWDDDFVVSLRPDDLDVRLAFFEGASTVPFVKSVLLEDIRLKYNDNKEHTFKLKKKSKKREDREEEFVQLAVRFSLLDRHSTHLDLNKVRKVSMVDAKCDSPREFEKGRRGSLRKVQVERNLMELPGLSPRGGGIVGGSVIRPRSRSRGAPMGRGGVDTPGRPSRSKHTHEKKKKKKKRKHKDERKKRPAGTQITSRASLRDKSHTLAEPREGHSRRTRSKSPRRDSLPREKREGKDMSSGSSKMHRSSFGSRTISEVRSSPIMNDAALKRLSIVVTGDADDDGRE